MNSTCLVRGREAAATGGWQESYDLLKEADATQPLVGEDLALLATVAYAAGHPEVTIEAWERAYAEGVRTGDRLAAAGAATRVAMHLLFDTALMAPVRAWLRRAEQLVGDQNATAVHAWLAVIRNYERMLSGEFLEARVWAKRAIAIGAQCDPGAAALGRIAEARCLVLEGEVRQGLDLLEQAALATVSGELDPIPTGIVYCELVCALQGLAQYDLAEEWTEAMERWRHGQPVGSLHGRCRVHRAEILRLRGWNREAEQEALRACEELRPYLRREYGWPLTELGQIRLRTGDLEGAEEAFLEAHSAGWDPQPGLALVHLARGDLAHAASAIRHALDHPSMIPSKELPPNTELRRAPLLEAQVEIAVAAGDFDRARWAADELGRIAVLFGSKALHASAAAALGRIRLKEGSAVAARQQFETAIHFWSEIGAPYETALSRMGVAEALCAEGNEAGALLEFRLARSVLYQIGAVQQAELAARACTRLGGDPGAGPELSARSTSAAEPRPVDRSIPPQISELRREGDYWCVTFDGKTARLRDLKGLRYLTRLFAQPGRELHVLDLMLSEAGWTSEAGVAADPALSLSARNDSGEMLDARAKDAYRRRLAEIEQDIEEARSLGDLERESQADSEREYLVRELSRAVGLGGRDRRAGSASERARASVTRAVRTALTRIREHHPQLGEHLDRCVRTGTYCAYIPDPRVPVAWKL